MQPTDSLSNTKTTVEDGIRVEKGIQPGDGAMTVKYRVTSERSDTAAVRLEEPLGGSFPVETLDLDAAGHGDWLLEEGDRTLVLVDILPAGDSVTTGYVVATADLDRVRSVFGEPRVDMVDPVDSAGSRSRADGDERAASGAGRDGDATVTEAAVAEALSPEVVAEALPPGTVVDALLEAFESGAVDEDDAERLREHVAPGRTRSEAVHLEHLQARLEEFAAYADGLSELIDEHGTATDIVDDMRDDIAATRASVAAVEDRLDDDAGEHDSVGERLDAVDDRLAAVEERLATVDERFGTVEERFAAVEGRFEAVEARVDERVADVAEEVSTLDEGLDRTNARLDRVGGRTDAVDARVDALADDLDGLRTHVDDVEARHGDSVTELADHVAELEADLAATEEWREQLGEAFQGEPSAETDGPDDGDESDDETAETEE